MLILILFAFLGGVATILSPCILPLLPVVLSGGLGRGKSRPLGIVAGFIASFTIFTLTLTSIVRATGINADALRYLAVGVILFWGTVLTVPRLHNLYSMAASRISGRLVRGNTATEDMGNSGRWISGFAGGVAVGSGLGLVWTPCAGPIMASVAGLALTGNVHAGAVFVTAAYSMGTAIPMMGVMVGGRRLLQRVPALLRNAEKIQRSFGVLVIVTAIAIGFGWDRRLQAAVTNLIPEYGSRLTAIENVKSVTESLAMLDNGSEKAGHEGDVPTGILSDYGPAPEIVTDGRWYNTEHFANAMMMVSSDNGSPPLNMQMLRGKVVLLDFWTYSCVNCLRTIPHLARWNETYSKDGLVIIGVHTPEFEFEKNPRNVQKAIADLGITWPVVLDNDYRQWQAYSNRFWPAHYFIDAAGHIRYRHFGEGGYEESEQVIRTLLKEAGADTASTPPIPEQLNDSGTPELYLGFERAGTHFVGGINLLKNVSAEYNAPRIPGNGEWTLSGRWIVTGEYIVPESYGSLRMGFNAGKVFLVIEPGTQRGRITVRVDGRPSPNTADVHGGILVPDESRLYQLVGLETPGPHILSLDVEGKIRLFAFTFG